MVGSWKSSFLLAWCIFRGMLVSGRVILLKTTVCQSTMGTLQFKNYMDLDGQGILIGNCQIEIQNESSTKSMMSSVIFMAHQKKQQLPWPIAILKIHENTIWNAKIFSTTYTANSAAEHLEGFERFWKNSIDFDLSSLDRKNQQTSWLINQWFPLIRPC